MKKEGALPLFTVKIKQNKINAIACRCLIVTHPGTATLWTTHNIMLLVYTIHKYELSLYAKGYIFYEHSTQIYNSNGQMGQCVDVH